MDSLCSSSLHPHPFTFSCSLRPIPIPKTDLLPPKGRILLTTKSKKPYFLRATSHSSPKPEPSRARAAAHPLISLIKPFSLTIATAAASFSILLSRFPSITPSLALASLSSPPPPPATTSHTLVQPDSDSDEIASFRADIERKIEQGDLMGAMKSLDQLITLQPANPDLPLLKAHLQSHMGDVNSAKRSFERLLEKDPYLVEAYHGLIMSSSNSESANKTELRELMKRVEKTIELCIKEKDSKERVSDFKLLLAQIKVILGEYEESLKVYEEMEKEDPNDFRPYLCQGIVYTLLNKKEEADQQFKKYKRLVPQGHPYEKLFDNMVATKIFGEREEAKKIGSVN